jgi:hypothetical protein
VTLLACTAALWLFWDPVPDAARYEVTLNHVLVYSGTATEYEVGPECGIACVRAVDAAGNPGPWACLLEYGPCAVSHGVGPYATPADLEAMGCCPVERVPWR